MRRPIFLLLTVLAVFVAARPIAGQKFLPKTIQFRGAPEYSNQELMAASGLKKGMVLSYSDMNDCSKRLMATGVIATMAFKFDGQDLIFTITPSTDLFPVHIENLPLPPGMDLDARLHDQLPLYHGKVPAEGGLNDAVRSALEKMLTDEGLQATVTATTAADLSTQKVNGVSYSITSPAVQVRVVQVDGASAPNQAKVTSLANDEAKNPYDVSHSANNLVQLIELYYNDQGFAGAKVHVARNGTPTMEAGAIVVPLSIQIEEGRVYSAKSVQLPPEVPVTQAEIDKILSPSSGGPTQGVRVRSVWALVASRYKSKGYLDCKVTPHAALDDATATVSYTVDVDPGPVYKLGMVKFDNVSDSLRTLLIHNWQMLPGDPFDENYVAMFVSKAQQQDPVLRQSLLGVKAKFDVLADQQTHVVSLVIRLEK